MTAHSGTGAGKCGPVPVDDQPANTHSAKALVGILDLDAEPAPPRPRSAKPPVLGVRLPPHLVSYVKGCAARDGVAINAFLIGCVERDRDRELPMDVVDWLLTEAAQLGHPGDQRTALVQVIRHLASLYPDGARLR